MLVLQNSRLQVTLLIFVDFCWFVLLTKFQCLYCWLCIISGEQQRRLPDFHHGLCFQCRSLERLLEDHLHSVQRIVCLMSSSIWEQKYKCLKYPLSDCQFHNPRILLAWDQFPLLSIAVELQVQGRHLGEFLWKLKTFVWSRKLIWIPNLRTLKSFRDVVDEYTNRRW